MKAQNLVCCATLAFANNKNRLGITCGGKRSKPSSFIVDKRSQSQLTLSNGNEHKSLGSDIIDTQSLGHHSQHRRAFVQTLSTSFLSSMLLLNAKPAAAACLAGDIRAECIGIYKLPIDAAESGFVDTEEKLKAFAPDLKWVPPVEYPPTYTDAVKQLKDQRQQLNVAQDLIAKGQIENTGLALLDIVPKVSAAGLMIVGLYNKQANEERNLAMKRVNPVDQINISNNISDDEDPSNTPNYENPSSTPTVIALETKAYRIEDALNNLVCSLGETDIMIGQGIRGELGALTPAQLEILSNIAICQKEYDMLLITVQSLQSAEETMMS